MNHLVLSERFVERLDERIADEQRILDRSNKREHRAFHAGQVTALAYVRSLVTGIPPEGFEETDLDPLLDPNDVYEPTPKGGRE